MAAKAETLDKLIAALSVQSLGRDSWKEAAHLANRIARGLGGAVRTAAELEAAYAQLVKDEGGESQVLGDEAVQRLRAARLEDLHTEEARLTAECDEIKAKIASVEAGELDHTAALKLLPESHPLRTGGIYDRAKAMQLVKILNAISKHKWAYPFKRPVTDREAPDYRQIIKNPMVRCARAECRRGTRSPALVRRVERGCHSLRGGPSRRKGPVYHS